MKPPPQHHHIQQHPYLTSNNGYHNNNNNQINTSIQFNQTNEWIETNELLPQSTNRYNYRNGTRMIGSNQLNSFPLITSSSVVTIASMLPATITTITDQSIMNNNNNNNNRSIDWLPKHLNALNQSLETMGLIDTTTINDQELIGTEIGSNDATSRLWFNHGSDLTLVIGSAVGMFSCINQK